MRSTRSSARPRRPRAGQPRTPRSASRCSAGRAAFIGRIADDTFGKVFAHDLRGAGVEFDVAPATDGSATGRCLVIVGSDAERTMCTYLGAGAELDPDDVDADRISNAAITYLEGYLWDGDAAKDAIRRAASLARAAGRKVALTLSDPFCVERHRSEFLELIGRASTSCSPTNKKSRCCTGPTTSTTRAARVAAHCDVAALTRGADGSVVVTAGERHDIPADPVDRSSTPPAPVTSTRRVSSYGLTHGHDPATCGRLGSLAAAEVISHLGARPQVSLADRARPLLNG